jgi:ABC-type Fe3+ transport system, periplasmic component
MARLEIIVRRIQQKEQESHPLKEKEIPDLTITHQLSIMRSRELMASSGHYETLEGLLPEMRSDLKVRGFDEPTGYFKPMCFVPIVIIHNRLVDTPPVSWEDLLDRWWKGKIGASSPDILRKLVTFYARRLFGKEADQLTSNVVFDGLPIDVNLKVDDGRLDVGIVPLPFSRSSRNRNVSICWPREGAFSLPHEVEENGLNLFWNGWDWFTAGINEV